MFFLCPGLCSHRFTTCRAFTLPSATFSAAALAGFNTFSRVPIRVSNPSCPNGILPVAILALWLSAAFDIVLSIFNGGRLMLSRCIFTYTSICCSVLRVSVFLVFRANNSCVFPQNSNTKKSAYKSGFAPRYKLFILFTIFCFVTIAKLSICSNTGPIIFVKRVGYRYQFTLAIQRLQAVHTIRPQAARHSSLESSQAYSLLTSTLPHPTMGSNL